jgi:hypothetical protein
LADPDNSAADASVRIQHDNRLDSWKKIASYLKRDVSTVQRWERREGMPVHRHLHDKQGSVFAFRSELDAWWETRRTRLNPEGADPSATTQILPPAGPAAPGPALRVVLLRVGAAVAIILVAASAWYASQSDYFWKSPLADAKFMRLSEFGGTEQSATISRDGKFVAFLAHRDGQTDVWVGEAGSGSYRNLTQGAVPELVNPSIRTLGFSADSSLVLIWNRQKDGSQPGDVSLLSVPVGGGPLTPFLRDAAEVDWSHDGKRLAYHTTAPGDPIFIRQSGKLEVAEERQIYAAPSGEHCHFPLWSPDDAYIYFVRGVPAGAWDVWRIRPSGAGLERITNHNSHVTFPVMLDRQTLAYLATDADGSGPWMYVIDVERRRPHRINSGLESYTSLAASADGRRLVAAIANGAWHAGCRADHPLDSIAAVVRGQLTAPGRRHALVCRMARRRTGHFLASPWRHARSLERRPFPCDRRPGDIAGRTAHCSLG